MKKILSILVAGTFGLMLSSCSRSDDRTVVKNQTNVSASAMVYEATGSFSEANQYTLIYDFPRRLNYTDNVLVYKKKMIEDGLVVWEPIPKTLYIENGKFELDYGFDFTVSDVKIFARGNYDISTKPQYLQDQTFRMVVVPSLAGKVKINYDNYEEVIKFYNIDDEKVSKI